MPRSILKYKEDGQQSRDVYSLRDVYFKALLRAIKITLEAGVPLSEYQQMLREQSRDLSSNRFYNNAPITDQQRDLNRKFSTKKVSFNKDIIQENKDSPQNTAIYHSQIGITKRLLFCVSSKEMELWGTNMRPPN